MCRVPAAALLALLLAVPALAGDYHRGATLVCSECHVMHYSQSHAYTPSGFGIWNPIGGGGPFESLLRDDVNSLCLSCHDNQGFAPDVVGGGTGGTIRAGGFLNRTGSATEATGHTLGSTAVAPGSQSSWSNPDGLSCIDCHDQHGYHPDGNAYRNLRHDPGGAPPPGVLVDYAVTTNDLSKDVLETAAGSYGIQHVWYNEPDPTGSAYADWCRSCHSVFHGPRGGAEVGGAAGTGWIRHPSGDADIGAVGGGHSSLDVFASRQNKVKVMSPTGVWTSSNPADLTGSTPSCFSCHKAHGNANPFGLIYMSGTGTVTENGDAGTALKDLCRQCHVQ